MNYREKIRKAIECPQFGNETYGEWGALRFEQRVLIKRLLDELDSADNCFKKVYLENKQLKKKYENAVSDYETTMFEKEQLNILVNSCQEEIRELKKQLEEKENIACNWKDSCLENAGKIEELETQQKEFIKYLEDYLKLFDYMCIDEQADYDMIEEILQKYKSIIGDDK